ncbi:G-type lectin S-receptor-like serine/threonine-protein kinase RKS1 [Quercus lobata]|uniref:G-type lectin S-receptor-like serine/threonine-protein kinase RKS1 n=1 Tax=Quercus lobata TaxID=97700 RepID=UPI001248B94C|nr:G-type lectin S-receptor-like serine/threonine-protein kinase RKS1 [Quercus lobata]
MYFTKGFLLLHTLLAFFIPQFDTLQDTLTISNPIRDGDLLVSKRETFALGFFSPGESTNRYVGIWFYKAPEQPVVWVANRDNPITDNSGVLSIDLHRNLVLYGEDKKQPIWSTNIVTKSNNKTTLAQLNHSGNLVLFINETSDVLWQSFDNPTDTFLPSMKLGLDRKTGLNRILTSWKSKDDPGIGNCSFILNTNSSSPELFLYKGNTLWWRSGHWNGIGWSGIPTLSSNDSVMNFKLFNNHYETSTIWGLRYPGASLFSRLVVNGSGSIQRSVSAISDQEWDILGALPLDRCDNYGKCGAFGMCQVQNGTEFECTCLPGFEPRSLSEWSARNATSGCVKKHGRASVCKSGEEFVKVENVKLPDSSFARVDEKLSLKECERRCLENCSCTAYGGVDVKEEVGCMRWYGELMDTRVLDGGQNLYVRVAAFELEKRLSIDSNLPSFEDSPSRSEFDGSKSNSNFPIFDLKTIIAATDNFSAANELGKGGFGSVYKGLLQNRMEIAVKRLSKYSGQGVEQFKNEVALIAKLQHRNLVRILGCCIQAEEKMLIYEYLPNKSLDSFIFDETKRSCLDWGKRFEIICGIARGILYLHQDSRLRIIHRDLKASNILLDNTLNPKISDFGMARIVGGDQIEVNTNRVVGTYGYMSPEYAMQGIFSIKSDVYSFGVLLLEIIVGKKNGTYYHNGPSAYLIEHVWDLWREGKVMEIVDALLGETYPANEVLKCIQIGLLCVQEHARDRPTMLTVVFMLGNDTTLPSPKQPAFISTSANNSRDMITSENEISISEIDGR